MSERLLKIRIVHKHDIEERWNEKGIFIPKQGEIIVYDRDEQYSYERMKIGDGITSISELPFVTHLSQSELDNAIQNSLKNGNYSIDADTLGGISSSEYALTEEVVTSVNGQVGDILLIDGNLVSIPGAEETWEEGQYIINAEQLGGIDSSRYALTENIVTSINGQTGDVIIEKEDLSDFYSSENQPPYPVTSVNGKTGEVVIEQPDLVRIEDATVDLEEGIYLANADQLGGKNAAEYALIDNVVTSINGQTGNVILENSDLSGFYSETNPPPYPVTSVNGMNGDVTIEQPDLVRIEDAEVDVEEGIYLTNADQLGGRNAAAYALKEQVVTSVNGQTGEVILEDQDLSNYYSQENPPPYPVLSVNGQSGEVILEDGLIITDTEENLEEGIYLTNADQLGGKNATEYALKEQLVTSVNGQIGEVNITAKDIGAITVAPVLSVNDKTGFINLTAQDVNALPNTYIPPVTSVDGQTGDVILDHPVKSVNGQTGSIFINEIKYSDITFSYDEENSYNYSVCPEDLDNSNNIINIYSLESNVFLINPRIEENVLKIDAYNTNSLDISDMTSSINRYKSIFQARCYYF